MQSVMLNLSLPPLSLSLSLSLSLTLLTPTLSYFGDLLPFSLSDSSVPSTFFVARQKVPSANLLR